MGPVSELAGQRFGEPGLIVFTERNSNNNPAMPSTSHENVFSILESPAAALATGVVIGFVIGRVTAPYTRPRRYPRTTTETVGKSISNGKLGESTENESSDEEHGYGEELQDFTNNFEECKLVLVVRTDLGMGKGILTMSSYQWVVIFTYIVLLYRKDSRAMLTCYAGLLQGSPQAGIASEKSIHDATTMGEVGSSQSHSSS